MEKNRNYESYCQNDWREPVNLHGTVTVQVCDRLSLHWLWGLWMGRRVQSILKDSGPGACRTLQILRSSQMHTIWWWWEGNKSSLFQTWKRQEAFFSSSYRLLFVREIWSKGPLLKLLFRHYTVFTSLWSSAGNFTHHWFIWISRPPLLQYIWNFK